MVHYKLHYFDVRALGEPIRLMFAYANIPYDDVRVTMEEWPKVKPSTPTGKLPYLEVDGKILTESRPIYHYLATQFGLVSPDPWDNAQMESFVDYFRDYLTDIRPYLFVISDRAEGDKKDLFENQYLPGAKRVFTRLTEILEASTSEYLANSGLTWGDFFMANLILTLKTYDPEFGTRFPKVLEYELKVHAVSEIQEYLKSRKYTVV